MIKFPYISQEARKIFNPYLWKVNEEPEVVAHLLYEALKGINKEKIDSCINYMITMVVKNKERLSKAEKHFINILTTDEYVNNLNYYKINRFTGLIDNILDNLYERNWETEENAVFLVELLVDYKEKHVRPYEKKKREENGDLL